MDVGFIGLGRMGGPMARNIRAAGHRLWVNDIRREACADVLQAGARYCASPAGVARQVEVVLISVPGPDEVEAVLAGEDGLLAGLRPGMLVIDTTTVSPAQSARNAARCAKLGADYIDAPVSGGDQGAVAGDLAAMIGAAPEAFERARPVLQCIAHSITRVGPVGTGSALKLLNQLIFISYQMAFAEGLTIGEALGLDLETMLEVLGASAAGHPLIRAKFDDIRGVRDAPGFAVHRALMYFDLAEQAGKDLGYAAPVFETVAASLRQAIASGHAEEDVIGARRGYRD